MDTYISTLQNSTNIIAPRTKVKAVSNDAGTSLQTLLDAKQDSLTYSYDATTGILSLTLGDTTYQIAATVATEEE